MIFSIMHILHFLSAFMCLPVILALQFVEFHFLEKKNCPVVYFVWREATNDRESFNLGPGANKYFKIPEHKYLVSIELKIPKLMEDKYFDEISRGKAKSQV